MALPTYWIDTFFNIPSKHEENNHENNYKYDFFNGGCYSIIDCRFQVPRANLWKGHPYYLELLKGYEKSVMQQPRSWEEVYSMPLWHNKWLKTKFDPEMSMKHFNFVGDLFNGNKVMTRGAMEQRRLNGGLILKVLKIIEKIPANYTGVVAKTPEANLVVRPDPYFYLNGVVHWTKSLKSRILYRKIIETKVSIPRGLLNWCAELELQDNHINLALSFATVQ